jgi:hypothetical protein
VKQHGEVQTSTAQRRKRVRLIHREQRQEGPDFLEKAAFEPLALLFGQLPRLRVTSVLEVVTEGSTSCDGGRARVS